MPSRRFTNEQVVAIRIEYEKGVSQRTLAFNYDCDRRQIQDIVQGHTYKTAGGPLASAIRNCPHCMQPMRKMA